jgi:hypothetical protein
VALRKPSDFFVRDVIEENSLPVLNADDSLREEINRVENLSEELSKLQQDLYQKTVENSSVVIFKEQVSELSNIVNNLVENEIPKYKKQVAGNEIRLSNQISNFKEDIDRKVDNFYQRITEFNDVIHVLETVSTIEKYVQEHHKDFVSLREEVFEELNNIPLGNIQNNLKILEEKIDLIAENYSQIQEGLLNEPPNVQNSDPLTPLDQKFVTVEDLNKHYSLFINRIQEQLATLGGGGETQLKYLDDIVGIATNPSAYNGKFLKYDHTIGKFVFANAGGAGSQTLDDTLQLGNTSTLGMSVGVVTATDFNSASDIKLKENVSVIDNPLDKIIRLEGVNFQWKETGKKSLGVIAQEVEKILPELVSGDDNKSVNYNGLVGLLIECVKQQQAEIEELKKYIDK